jgi:RNA polymerase sigma-70 factor, ECF subfamily
MTMSRVSCEDVLAPLVARARTGNRAAVEELVREVRPRVLRYVVARLLDPHAAEDVTQEVMMTALSSLPRYVDQGRPFTAWVFGIASNKVSESRRAASRRHERVVETIPEQTGDGAYEPEHAAARLEAARQVAAMLDTLPAPQAEILRLRIAAGLSADETAAVLGMSPGAVRVAQHRALARLRAEHAVDVLS